MTDDERNRVTGYFAGLVFGALIKTLDDDGIDIQNMEARDRGAVGEPWLTDVYLRNGMQLVVEVRSVEPRVEPSDHLAFMDGFDKTAPEGLMEV